MAVRRIVNVGVVLPTAICSMSSMSSSEPRGEPNRLQVYNILYRPSLEHQGTGQYVQYVQYGQYELPYRTVQSVP